MTGLSLLDFGIAAIALVLAWRALFSRDLFYAIIYFVALGLVVALVWVRLDAPDVAIAEAAIGAGLTGALLFMTWRRLGSPRAGENGAGRPRRAVSTTLVLSAVLAVLLSMAVGSLQPAPGLAEEIAGALPRSGVVNPVTAVLLNYRSFDTLLEIGVLFLTVVAVRALGLSVSFNDERLAPSDVLAGLVRFAAPLSVLVGAYLLWAGASTPGGAFQAGAVWAGALILVRLAYPHGMSRLKMDWPTWVGLAVFVAAAVGTYWLTGHPLAYPTGHAGVWILVIEVAAALSIAAVLYQLFSLDPAARRDDESCRS